jgi:hypothetical protein
VPLTQFDLRAVSASNNLYSTGTVVLSGGANVTVGTNAQTITIAAAAQSVQTQSLFSGGVSNLGNTAGSTGVSGTRMVLVGSQNVTLSQSTDANGNTISLSAAGGGAGAFSAGVSTAGNTAGSTGVTGTRLVLVGSNMVSLSQSTDANGGTVSVNATQTVQTQDVLSAGVSTGGNTAGNTTVNTGSRLVLVGSGMVSLSQATAAGASTISISATQSVQTQSLFSAGASNLGNTAGSTGVTGTRLVLVGTNMVSLSQSTDASGGTVSVNATQTVQTQDVLSIGLSTGGNTQGNTTVNTGSRLVLVGTNNITLSQATAAGATTVSISGPAAYTASMWPAIPNPIATSSMISGTSGSTGGSSQTTAHFYIAPYVIDENVTFNQIRGAISGAISAGTGSISAAHYLGIYTLNANTALSLVSSMIFNVVASQNSQTNYTGKWWWGTDSNANSNQASGAAVSNDFIGLRPVSFTTGANSLPAGDYWIAHGYTQRTSGASIGGWNSAAFMNITGTTIPNLHVAFGTTAPISPIRYLGVFTTTSNATTTNLLVVPGSIHTSVISGTNAFSLWLLPNITIMST